MHLSLSWSWIVGVVAALIVIASLAGSRRRRGEDALEPPADPQLDDSGTFPVLTPPEEPAEILMPPEAGKGVEVPAVAVIPAAAESIEIAEVPAGPAVPESAPVSEVLRASEEPAEDELDEALDDALDRVVK